MGGSREVYQLKMDLLLERGSDGLKKYALLIVLLVLGVALAGCCSVVPFIKCKVRPEVHLKWEADATCNGGHSVQLRFHILKDSTAFVTVPTQVIFKPGRNETDYEALGVLDTLIKYAQPDTVGQHLWKLPEVFTERTINENRYLGVAANFAEPGETTRAVVALRGLSLPLKAKVKLVGSELISVDLQ
jgi:predicted component of type VI protein secretion system